MITSSGKQNDKGVETSIVHLMQMYMFVIEVLQKSKYNYPASSWLTSGAALGICKFLFLKGKTACGRLSGRLVCIKHVDFHKTFALVFLAYATSILTILS